MNNKLSKDDIAEKMFLEGKSITQIAKELKIDRGCLSIRLKKRGVKIEQHCNKKAINKNIFSSIDTEEKAYWLGFLMADGCVSTDNYIELSLRDEEHIQKYKDFLGSEHKISKKKSILKGKEFISYRLTFKDKQIADDLIALGCIPNKTFDMHMPLIDDKLIRHWLRGYFDGDGHLKVGTTKGNSFVTISSGNQYILEEICTYVNELLPLKTKLYVRKTHSCYELRTFNTLNTYLLLNYMYQDASVFLDRKHEKFTHYCRLKSKILK